MTAEPTYSGLQFNDLLRVGDWEVINVVSSNPFLFDRVGIRHKANQSLCVSVGVFTTIVSELLSSFVTRCEKKALGKFAKEVIRHNALMAAVDAERGGKPTSVQPIIDNEKKSLLEQINVLKYKLKVSDGELSAARNKAASYRWELYHLTQDMKYTHDN
jgi:hypothetical protein